MPQIQIMIRLLFSTIDTRVTIQRLNLYNKFAFSQIEEHKPTPAQVYAQRQGLMAKKMLENKYKLINSTPNDNIDKIHQNFIHLKRTICDPHYIIPHKRQYLLLIDEAYDKVLSVHDDYNVAELNTPRGRLTKKQLIAYELEKIEKAKKLELVQTYQFSMLLIFLFVLIQILMQQISNKDNPQFSMFEQMKIGAFVSKKLSQFEDYIRPKIGELTQEELEALAKKGIRFKNVNYRENQQIKTK